MMTDLGYDPNFDEVEGDTESPDVHAAERALWEAQTGSTRTDEVIRESRQLVAILAAAREQNHFAERFRKIIHGHQESLT